LWFWTRFNREKGERREAKGMPPGGYRALTDAIVASLRKRGAVLHSSAPVSSIDIDPSGRPVLEIGGQRKAFHQAAITVALPIADKLIRFGSTLRNMITPVDFGINYLAVINLVLVSRKSFSPHYWVASIVRDMPFQGVVETSQLGPLERFGGRNLLYLMRYLDRDHPDYTTDSEELKTRFLDAFFKQFPHISRDDIEAAHLFRAPYVEPAYTAGYLRRRPPVNVFDSRVFLATTAQVYPTVTSWNGAVGFARGVADEILRSTSGMTGADSSPSGGRV
jgi:protoporphyrinogen oxidase